MAETSLRTRPGALARELARRGITQGDLEKLTSLSRSVLGKVNRGESVSERTLGRIGRVLQELPTMDAVDDLLGIQREQQAS